MITLYKIFFVESIINFLNKPSANFPAEKLSVTIYKYA